MGICCLQLDLPSFSSSLKSSSLHIYFLYHLLESGKNIDTQSMCPSSHLLRRFQCRFISLKWANQEFEPHFYISQAGGPLSLSPTLLLKSFSHEVRRKAAFVLVALAWTPSPLPLWLSVFPSFLKPKGNGGKHLFGVTSNSSVRQNLLFHSAEYWEIIFFLFQFNG